MDLSAEPRLSHKLWATEDDDDATRGNTDEHSRNDLEKATTQVEETEGGLAGWATVFGA